MTTRTAASGRVSCWLLLGYAVFIVYGSLVPLDFRPYALDKALADFARTPWLQLGLESRADWVANGVLYAPLGLLAARCAALPGLGRVVAGVLAATLCAALAVGVEFVQLFFPPRTVSLNDIWAECVGSVVGATLAPFMAGWLSRLATAWGGGQRLGRRLLEAYALVYLALSFFPYDLLLSAAELHDKAASDSWGWLLAVHARGPLMAALQLLVEAALAAPLGALLLLLQLGGRGTVAGAAAAGALAGLGIELGQFVVASGISQGASVLSRALGFAAGAWLLPRLQAGGAPALRTLLGRLATPAWVLYLLLLLYANGLFSHGWRSAAGLAQSWAELHLLPFYYHYFTSEALALSSLGAVALMVLPATVLGWARFWSRRGTVGVVALLVAAIETCKLLLVDLHPDPTNVVIAIATSALALQLLRMLERPTAAALGAGPAPVVVAGVVEVAVATRPWASAWLLLPPLALVQALLFPVAPLPLALAIAAAAAAAWRRPWLPLLLLPAALPLLDLAPFSGRLLWDAFDMLSAACLGVALHRCRHAAAEPQPRWLSFAAAVLALSLLASTLRALWPLPALLSTWDGASFDNPFSPFNALRIAKGAVWAWLLLRLWRRLGGIGAARSGWLGAGMAAGLAGTVVVVLWERLSFAGLLDTAAAFRVSGPFSAMHTGGAFIECWLAVASAFALAIAVGARRWPARAGALLLLAGATYALGVTYSRNGYAALAVVLVVGLLSALAQWLAQRRASASSTASTASASSASSASSAAPVATPVPAAARAQAAWALAALLALVAVAAPVVLGPYASARLATTAQDLAVRQAHWADGLQMRDHDAASELVGMGLGRFPDTHFWRSQESRRAARYGLVSEPSPGAAAASAASAASAAPAAPAAPAALRYLRLAAGATLYLDQIVHVPDTDTDSASGRRLLLSASVRPAAGTGTAGSVFAVSLCDKWLLTSQRCVQAGSALQPGAVANQWQHVELPLDAAALLQDRRWWRPPLTLSLLTPAQGALDVSQLRLADAGGQQLLVNGDFAHGMDRWFFTTDVDPPWQLHSLPLQLLFDQGWFGVLAWALLLGGALVAGTRLAWQGRALVPGALPALCGFLASGTLNTLIDTPRFLQLLLLLAWLAVQLRRDIQPGLAAGGPIDARRAA